jgi:subtilisin family serine protease
MIRSAALAAALVAGVALPLPAFAQAPARPAHGVDGAALVRLLGPAAARAYAPAGAKGIGAQVILPPGVSGADLGLMDLVPGYARFRGSPAALVDFAAAHPDVGIEVAPPLRTLLDTASVFIGANTAIQQGLDGTGILVGIADTGLDVTHPDFLDASGHSRVAWYLDLSAAPIGLHSDLESQFNVTDATGKKFGAVWAAADLDQAIANAPSTLPRDELGHGTLVSSCAAGNGMGGTSPYRGIAPGATLLLARVTPAGSGAIDTDYLLLGASFLFDRADAMGQPVVVNFSLGSDFGPHDGTLAWEQTLAGYVGPGHPGRAIVAAAGNSGSVVDTPVHQNVHVNQGTTMSIPVITNGAQCGGVQVWVATRPGDSIKVGLESTHGTWISPVAPGKSVGYGTPSSDPCPPGPIAAVYNGSQPAGSPVPADSQGAVVVWQGNWPSGTYRITLSGSGTADLYFVATGDAAVEGLGSVGFAQAVRDATITLPATQPAIIGVGCTINKPSFVGIDGAYFPLQVPLYDAAGGTATGALRSAVGGEPCWFSSAGPTLTGVAKPDVMAPGAAIIGALSQQAIPPVVTSIFTNDACPPSSTGTIDETCQQIDAFHAAAFGTSFSAPLVAGTVAIMLEHDPSLTQDVILAALQGGAHPLRAPATFEDQAGPGEVDVPGAIAAVDRIRDPLYALPVLAQSWLTPSAEFYRADGSTPLQAILELRAAPTDGSAPPPADGFANDRLGAFARVDGKPYPGGVRSLDRRGPGVWVATVVLPAGLGGDVLTLGATFDGQPIVSDVSVPIAVDAWDAQYPATIPAGCSLAGAGRRATPGGVAALLLAALAMLRVSRSRRRRLSPRGPADATGAAKESHLRAEVSHQMSHDPTVWRDEAPAYAIMAHPKRHVPCDLREVSLSCRLCGRSLARVSRSVAHVSGPALRLASRAADRRTREGESGSRRARGSRDDVERPHHLVGGVLEVMAVPDVAAGVAVEAHDDARDRARVRANCVLPARLGRVGRHRFAAKPHALVQEKELRLEELPVEDLKSYAVQVDRVRVVARVDEAPDLGRAEVRLLGHRVGPPPAVEQHPHPPLVSRLGGLGDDEGPRPRRGRLGEPNDRANARRHHRAIGLRGRGRHAKLKDVVGVVAQDDVRTGRLAEVDEEVGPFGGRELEMRHGRRRGQ